MSFLNQLKNQAKELQTQQDRQHLSLEVNTARLIESQPHRFV